MSDPASNYPVGRGRPPRKSRWKKGQSGNPRRKSRNSVETAGAMMDRLLSVQITITVNGQPQSVPTLQAVMLSLSQNALSGNIPAKKTFLKYVEFAKTHSDTKPQITFVDSDYTKAVAQYADIENG